MTVVLDASMALSWLFKEETDDHSLAALDRVVEGGAVVPSLWRLEVANALQIAIRRGRIDAAYREDALRRLAQMQIVVDEDGDVHAWTATLALADEHNLTMYDAAYLELARRRRCALLSRDAALNRAASRSGLPA